MASTANHKNVRKNKIYRYFVGGSRYELRRKTAGALFALPWIIGVIVFFLQPLARTFIFSFANTSIELVSQPIDGSIFSNYIEIFTRTTDFYSKLVSAVQSMLYSLPLTIVFSMFIANILVKPFRGRTFMRSVFFLPVIVASGIIITLVRSGLTTVSMGDNPANGNIFNTALLGDMLLNSGFPESVVNFIRSMIGNIMDLVWTSGVQILIFMSGMLSIPQSYYEVASVEGATGWERFWKITFPLIVPHILINSIYTIIDMLSAFDNDLMKYIINDIYVQHHVSTGSAMSWIYILVVLLLIGLILLVITLASHDRKSKMQRR